MDKRVVTGPDGQEVIIWLPQKIVLTLPAYGDMLLATRICPVEVSGYAKVSLDDNQTHLISDVVIPHQICSGGGTISLGDDLHWAMQEIVEQGKDPKDFYCWWHSHVGGTARFSSTDIYNLFEFLRYLLQGNKEEIVGPWLSIVLNQHAEVSGQYAFARPAHMEWHVPVVLENGVTENDIRDYINFHHDRIYELLMERVIVRLEEERKIPLSEFMRLRRE